MSNNFEKIAVLDSFLEEVNSYLPEIEANLERLANMPGDMDALEETYRRAHTIGGSASMMEFSGLAHVAHGMEDILGDALDGVTTLNELTLGILHRSLGRLHRLLEGIRTGAKSEDILAEDDADYAQYSAMIEAASQSQPSQVLPVIQSQASQKLPPVQQPSQPVPTFQHQVSQKLPAIAPTEPRPASRQPTQPQAPVAPQQEAYPVQESPSAPPMTSHHFEPVEASSSHQSAPAAPMPTLEEVLNSFRTPSLMPGDDLDWPEDPPQQQQVVQAPASYWPAQPVEEQSYWSQVPAQPMRSSAFDELMSSSRSSFVQPQQPPQEPIQWEYADQPAEQVYSSPSITNAAPQPQEEPAYQPVELDNTDVAEAFSTWNALAPSAQNPQPVAPVPAPIPTPGSPVNVEKSSETSDGLPVVYQEAQQGVESLESQAATLRDVAQQLRSAMTIIESQRGEFKGFLDGSKDALDRMEEWAGKAMGLNLRNSPEQVRRYLPLSVMWVANSKLKKVLDLLRQITGNVELTDEQFTLILQQLQASLNACEDVFKEAQDQASHVLHQEPGWNAWQMQQESGNLHERVTFERQGNLDVLRAQIKAEMEEQLRQEISREYAERPLSLAARAEIEQQIRAEMRHEFELRRHLQESVVGGGEDKLKELEARLRNEIEIQVRQEFLSQLNHVGGDVNFALQNAAAQQPTGPMPPVNQSIVPPVQKPTLPPPPPVSNFGDFGEEAIEIFRTEAEEHLHTISMHVAGLEKDHTNRDLIQGIRRATHTLKGAAGMMGFRPIADLCHVSEDLLDSVMEGGAPITPAVLSIILDTAEALDILINGRGTDGLSDDARVQQLRVRYIELLGEQGAAISPAPEVDLEDVEEPHAMTSVLGEQIGSMHQPGRGDLSVHVRLSRLDELVNLFGELLVNRSVLEERLSRLTRLITDVSVSSNRLNDVGQKMETRFEAATLPSGRTVSYISPDGQPQLPGANKTGNEKAYLAEFDALEMDRYTEFHQLTRSLGECISDMTTLSTEMDTAIRECEGIFQRESRLSTTFQDRLMKTRLVPLSAMTPRLYRAARAVAFKQNKEISFVTEGETTEVDRTVFEEISGPLLHLVRNAVNHAIEIPETRARRGKAHVGQIKLSASYEGNQIVITVSDDGMGIDRDAVRNTAIARGLIRPNQQLSESDVIELIFHPGFSTAEVLSEESGRGVGLDVVRDSVSRLRGKIVVESTPGQGTAFTMTFPTSLAIQNAMMVRVSGEQFAIPTVAVESIGRLDNFKRTTSGGQPAVTVQNEIYPLQLLSHYLGRSEGSIDEKSQLLFVSSAGQHIALIVDEIIGRSDIVMKNLGPHLRQVHGIAGGTILGNGRVVLVLELNDLLSSRPRGSLAVPQTPLREGTQVKPAQQVTPPQRSAQTTAAMRPIYASQTTQERGKHVLVVDDSPSVRRVVTNMLKQHGWEVQAARDGVEALEMISREAPAAVLLDIEMPRMDGYELISTVRAQAQYQTLPLVVLTSRAAAKHQQRAMLLGADAYVVKPYQDEELITILNSLVYGAAVR
jgi:chemotaxis protein histidine kinase CheA/ActR/RegA family two-component response regulator